MVVDNKSSLKSKPKSRKRGYSFGTDRKKEYEEEVLQISRVTRVVKGGRRLRFRVAVVIGNKKGKVGFGVATSKEVVGGIQKAVARAKKNIQEVCIKNDTVPYEVYIKYKAAKIIFMPAKPGTGIIVGGVARKIIELAGIKNIYSKRIGSNNKISNARATILALVSFDKNDEFVKSIVEEKKVDDLKIKSDEKTENKVKEGKKVEVKSKKIKKVKKSEKLKVEKSKKNEGDDVVDTDIKKKK